MHLRRPGSSSTDSPSKVQAYLDLVDWRRQVGDLYRLSGPDALEEFRRGRDRLFKAHPQSPIADEKRASFSGLTYFAPDPAYRVRCRLEPDFPARQQGHPVAPSGEGDSGCPADAAAGAGHDHDLRAHEVHLLIVVV